MSHTFEIGEIAIFVNPDSRHFGSDVTVTSALKRMRLWDNDLGNYRVTEGYELDAPFLGTPPKGQWATEPHNLRKKNPPQDPAFKKFRDQLETGAPVHV